MSSTPQTPTYIIPSPSSPNWKTPLVIVALVLLAATNVFLYMQLDRLKTENRAELTKIHDDLNSTIEKMQIASADALQRSRRTLEQQLEAQKRAADRAVGQAKIDAQQRVQALQGQVTAAQQAQAEALSAVKTSAEQTSTKLADVNTDVQNTKGQLQDTIGSLKRATGELDNHTSLIATNAKELQALRDLGERNYTEFTVNRNKQYARVGDVQIELKKVDIKRNKFTISLLVDDKTVEKKDRTINEPIQFYTSKARQPDEIVVNSVRKDTIVGYLATPKVQTARTAS